MRETAFGTKSIIFNSGKILILVKKNGQLDLPGGKVRHNEFFSDCIVREVLEETGLSVKDLKPAAEWSFFRKDRGYNIIGVTYLCNCISKNVHLSNEHKSYFWTDAEDILRFQFQPPYGLNKISQKNIRMWQEMDRYWSLPQIK
jgi:8-oxo-dGTP pyrophosphatase MutT (NUDIX family)